MCESEIQREPLPRLALCRDVHGTVSHTLQVLYRILSAYHMPFGSIAAQYTCFAPCLNLTFVLKNHDHLDPLGHNLSHSGEGHSMSETYPLFYVQPFT